MPKRKREHSFERLQRKIKKYQEKLSSISMTPPMERLEREPSASPSREPELVPSEDIIQEYDTPNIVPIVEESEENQKNEDDILDEEVLTLLGDAPQEQKFGPPIHKELATRWLNIVKNGLSKEKRAEIKKLYLPPENCKNIDAPKLNLEAKAAVSDLTLKRDKAIAAKQSQIGCALTSLAMVFCKIYKNKENLPALNHLSDAARLLCDLQFQENLTRRNFILQGLEQMTRDTVKDTEADEWLFGEGFTEKLKASKAIKKSGKEISVQNQKKPHQPRQTNKHLNYKGPVANPSRSYPYQSGPQRFYQKYKKPVAQNQPVSQGHRSQPPYKPPPKRT